jgi:hypothetical protein
MYNVITFPSATRPRDLEPDIRAQQVQSSQRERAAGKEAIVETK